MPSGFDEKGFCSQIAVFDRVKRRKLKKKEKKHEFEVLIQCEVPANFSTRFEYKFFNDFLYSMNVARNWLGLDYEDGVPIDDIFRVPAVNMLCDGSIFRLYELIHLVLPKYQLCFRVDGKEIFVVYENIDENENFE